MSTSANATPPSTPVLRVKRRRSQSPAGALLLHLSAKKRRENSEDSTPTSQDSPKKEAVFKFTATLDKDDHDSLKTALNKADRVVKSDPKLVKRIGNKTKSKDDKTVDSSSEKRYRIISNIRGIKNEDQEESERLFKLVDVIKDDKDTDDANENSKKSKAESVEQITCNGVPLVKLAEEEYVYDVYTMQSDAMSSTGTESDQDTFNADFDAMDIVDISFLDCRDLNVDEYRSGNLDQFDIDSDSNDEDHWKNDYPDEDDFSEDFNDEADYRDNTDLDLDFENFHLKHGNTEVASSPEESADEEELVFSTTAAFEQDANLHGTSYAKWKRQMLKDMGEEDDDYYDDDINEVDEF